MTDARATTVLDYQDIIAAVRARIDQVKAPHTAIEEAAGISVGYLGRIIGPAQVAVIGLTVLIRLLESLGLRLAIIEHLTVDAAIEEMGHRYRARSEGQRIVNVVRKRISPEVKRLAASEFGAMGRGVPKTFGISARDLSRKQRKAARSRWAKVKATKQYIGVTGAPR